MPELKPLAIKRLLSKTEKIGSCWIWTGATTSHKYVRYGVLVFNKKHYRAHRFSWMYHYGNIPNGQCVLHKCDNGLCVNPEHLFLGDRIDNNMDREKKRRGIIVYGSKNGLSKLDEKKVKEIKNCIKDSKSFSELGKKYGVRWQTIQAIAKGKTWKHV